MKIIIANYRHLLEEIRIVIFSEASHRSLFRKVAVPRDKKLSEWKFLLGNEMQGEM